MAACWRLVGRAPQAVVLVAVSAALIVALSAQAQENRIALVIGNTAYDDVIDLANPQNDAPAISAALRGLGFDVHEHVDLDRNATLEAIRDFGRRLSDADVALLFYAGHAIQYNGINYLVPTDAALEAAGDIDFELIDLELITKQMQSQPRISLIFLDACRDNPFDKLKRAVRGIPTAGLAKVSESSLIGTYIAYATSPDRVAYDGEGEHSPFTTALLKHIDAEGVELRTMMTRVRQEVFKATAEKQLPWDASSLLTEFYFRPSSGEAVETADRPLRELEEALGFAGREQRQKALNDFLRKYLDGPLVEIARNALRELEDPPVTSDNRQPILAFMPPLVVEGGTIRAPLNIPPPRDPDPGDQLRASVVELPNLGMVRSRGLQLNPGDELSIEQLTHLDYYAAPDAVGEAGQLAFRVYDSRGGSVLGVVPVRILEPNQPPSLIVPATVTATVGSGGVPLDFEPPTDPDIEDRVIVRVDQLPDEGALTLDDVVELSAGAALTGEELKRLVYRPPAAFATPDGGVIRFIAEDGRGGRTEAEMAVVLMPPNQPPQWGEDLTLRVSSDGSEAPIQLAQPTDPDGDALTITVSRLPFAGTVRAGGRSVEAGTALAAREVANLSYQPPSNFFGNVGSLTLEADDGRGGTATQDVTILVEPRNRPPIVEADREVVAVAGQVMPLGIIRPVDPDGHKMDVRLLAVPSNGVVLLGERSAGSGMALTPSELSQLRFRAALDAVDTSGTLTYAVADDRGGIVRSKVRIRVKAPNRPPIATAARTVATSVDKEPVRLVIEAASDPDGDALEVRVRSLPLGGEVLVFDRALRLGERLSPDELLAAVYRATGDFVGPAGSFGYAIMDGQGGTATGETRVIVEEPNRPPMVAYGTFIELPADVGPVALNLARPMDPEGDSLSVTLLEAPATSTLRVGERKLEMGDQLSVDELLGLTAEAGLEAVGARESMSFEVTDDRGGATRGVVVIQIVPPPNKPPTVAAPSEVVAEAAGDAVAMSIDAPADPDGDPLEITVTVLPRSGEIRLLDRVIGVGDRVSPDELTRLLYEPPDFPGPMGSFMYDVRDGRGGEATSAVVLTVTRRNRPPIAFVEPPVDVVAGTPAAPTPLYMRIPVDPDGDPIMVRVAELPQTGSVQSGARQLSVGDDLASEDFGRLTYHAGDAAPGAKGRFAYVVRDSRGVEAAGGVDLRVVPANKAPTVPGDATVTARSDQESVLVLKDLPSDPDGDALTTTILRLPYSGALEVGTRQLRVNDVLTVDELAFLRYRPAVGFHGQAGMFRYRVEDGRGGAVLSSVTITVERPNRPPVSGEPPHVKVVAGGGRTGLGLELPIDPDGDPLIAEIVDLPNAGILRHGERQLGEGATLEREALAQLTFDAAPGITGPLGDLRLRVRDGRGGSVIIGASLEAILPPNRRPIVLSRGGLEAILGAEPERLGLAVPVDPDGDPLTVTVTEIPQQGSTTLGSRKLEVGSKLAPDEVPQIHFDTRGAEPGHAGAFQIEVADSRDAVAHTRVPIEILLPPNQPPTAVARQEVAAIVGVGTVSLPIELPSDPDRDQIVIRLTAVPDNGTMAFDGRPAQRDMLLTPEEFAQARFTPNRDEALSRGNLAATSSTLSYEVDDGRGGIVAGEIVIRAQVHDCDLLASSADNIESVAPGIPIADLEGERGAQSCAAALVEFPSIGRFRFQLARAQEADDRYQEALENYRIAAATGDLAAKHNLAVLLFDPPPGADFRRNPEEAVRLLREASVGGSTSAQKSLAAVMWHGQGLEPDPEEAVKWLLQATKQDDPEALTHLAMAYATGRGARRNVDEAIRLLERAAARGYAPAQTNLGYLYASGEAGRVDLEQAAKWFAEAADQGDPRGLLNLGKLFLLGTGVERDPVRAVKLYAQAVRRADGDVEKMVMESLEGLPQDIEIAVLQTLLTEKGYRLGPVDGRFGSRTRAALIQFEQDTGRAATGEPAPDILLDLAALK